MLRASECFLAVLCIGLVTVGHVSAQKCPITTQKANSISFAGVKKSCSTLDASNPSSCDACLCSLTDSVLPTLQSVGFDLASAGGFAGASTVLQACMMTLAPPLAAAGVPLSSLLGLTSCPYDADNVPICVRDFVPEIPEPLVAPVKSLPEVEIVESFVEEVAAECLCTSDFDPVCDYNGFWFTNYCVAKCKGAKLVERCSPVFKAIIKTEEPFVLLEKDAPLLWKPGCFCPQSDDDFDPVCDIDGKQYPSLCYAKCLAVEDVFDCGSLVIDFVLSGEGPIVEEPKVEGQSGQEPDTVKPPVDDISSPVPPSPATRPKPPPSKPKPNDPLPEEVVALFQQLGVDVSAFPPELTMMAYKIILGEQITKKELKRAREIISDEESMAEARQKLSPTVIQQLEVFALGATGNNKTLLDELLAALRANPDSGETPEDKQALRTCLKGCRDHKPVCSVNTGAEYASACHARCQGVTDTRPCYHHDDSGVAGAASAAVCSVLTLFGAIAAAHL